MEMLTFFRRHRETLIVTLLGLMIFGALNGMMVCVDPDRFTNIHFGAFTAFKRLQVSGFDFYTYMVVSTWEPRYELIRHPLLFIFMWPLAQINDYLKDAFGINCTIYIVGIVWTIISTTCLILLYKIIRKAVGLSWFSSIIYSLMFFSFSHVMLVTFIPDHMVLSLFILLLTIYIISTAQRSLPVWKSLLLYFIGSGITATNSIKIWMMDMVEVRFGGQGVLRMFRRSLFFFIPTLILLGCMAWQKNTTEEDFVNSQKRMTAIKMKTDSTFAKQRKKAIEINTIKTREKRAKQLGQSMIFEFTDNSIGILPLLYENIFGEGLLLHMDHALEDANANKHRRPAVVEYDHWWYYAINATVVILCLCGLWTGRRTKIMWLAFLPFLFDMLLHGVLRFAATDVYIMTAHWAFILPIGIALLEKSLPTRRVGTAALRTCAVCLTVFLWLHNLPIIIHHLAQF